jgi:hypothetical protein
VRQILDRVTITGADDSIQPQDIIALTKEFPFVEWGILLSKHSEGKPRFPTYEWLCELLKSLYEHTQISGHICGRWVRDICKGDWTIAEDRSPIINYFRRFQLNFRPYLHKIKDVEAFIAGFQAVPKCEQFIFQLNDINNELLRTVKDNGVNAAPFFDLSGGIGVLPESWPKQLQGLYCGYAGGLSPDNLTEQLELISSSVEAGPIWIDVESHVRTDERFDLDKVVKFIKLAEPWVVSQKK